MMAFFMATVAQKVALVKLWLKFFEHPPPAIRDSERFLCGFPVMEL